MSTDAQQPTFLVKKDATETHFRLSGDCVALTLDRMPRQFGTACKKAQGAVCLDLEGLGSLDSSGAQFLLNARRAMERRGIAVSVRGLRPESEALFERVAALPEHAIHRNQRQGLLYELDAQGRMIVGTLEEVRDLCGFWGMLLTRLARCVSCPWKLRKVSVVAQLEQSGVRAVPIVALLNFLIGLVLAYMGSAQLSRMGANLLIVDLVSIASLRELAVLIMAIIVAGRSGSAFTAQIGSMVANEEVSAMRAMGLNPMDVLVLPRVVALLVACPLLTVVADLAALLGGMLAAQAVLDISPEAFLGRFHSIFQMRHFWVGMIKAPAFALVIACIGCFQGFRVTGSAESVGRLTTRAVVHAIFLVILMDALFALFFLGVGL